jgi:DNA-binding response OmpR family regulator
MAQTVVVIEDEAPIADAVAARLRSEGFDVEVASDGPSGVELVERVQPAIVVLDLMLPGFDGLEVCRRIQRERPVPVLMLTAKDAETDLLVGLAVGADDYLTKPFSIRELLARVRAMLRRVDLMASGPAELLPPVLTAGPLLVDATQRLVSVAGQPVELTPKEFDLLTLLVRHPGRAFARDYLIEKVWGHEAGGSDRTVDTHILRLRKKLGAVGEAIETVWGVGYRLAARPSERP